MMKSALNVEELTISFGGVVAVQSVSFSVQRGGVFSIIGPNGAGKTTLFNMISGLYKPNGGRIVLNGSDVTGRSPYLLARDGLSRTFQNLQVFPSQTAIENVMIGRTRWEATSLFADLLGFPSVARQNLATRQHAYEALELVGLGGYADSLAGDLPYGVLKRLEIARALTSEPSLLLLDEPAAGCNGVETAEIVEIIREIIRRDSNKTVILIEHDMKMVMQISDEILVLNQGQVLACGSPEEVRGNTAVIDAYLGSTERTYAIGN